jgi:hypothetical protein
MSVIGLAFLTCGLVLAVITLELLLLLPPAANPDQYSDKV